MKLKILALLFFLSYGKIVFAQDDLDKKNTPESGSLLGSSGDSDKKSGRYSEVKNAVKINFALLARSNFHLLYERAAGSFFSAECGLGLTFEKDYIQYLGTQVNEGGFDLTTPNSTITFKDMLQYSDFGGAPDISASLGGKFYFAGGALSGPYCSMGIRYSAFSLRLKEDLDADNYSSYYYSNISKVDAANRNVQIQNMNFNLLFGYQAHTDGRMKTTHEYYVGIGLRKSSYDSYEVEERVVNTSSGSHTEYTHSKKGIRESVVAPAFLFGYVFGFGF